LTYTQMLQPITGETVDGLILALYQIMLCAPVGQEHLSPNVRTITLTLPWNFRTLYTRAFPHGTHVGVSECGWFVMYKVKVSLLYDYLHRLGLVSLQRTDFTNAVRVAKNDLIRLEKEIENLVPQDVLEKVQNKIVETLDKQNEVDDNTHIE